jgi:hypothetical protein
LPAQSAKPDISRVNKTGQIDLLRTEDWPFVFNWVGEKEQKVRKLLKKWCARHDSNVRPFAPEANAGEA